EANRTRWVGSLAQRRQHVEFVRGLARLTVTGRNLTLKAFAEAFTTTGATALVERVQVTAAQALQLIAAQDVLEWVPTLSLTGLGLKDEAVAPLWSSPHLGRLVGLDLSNNRLSNGGGEELAASELIRHLAWLDLRNNRVALAALDRLVGRQERLRDLDL